MVLYSFWVASFVGFNGDTARDLATQFLGLAESLVTRASRFE
jgi:hypothetical protein